MIFRRGSYRQGSGLQVMFQKQYDSTTGAKALASLSDQSAGMMPGETAIRSRTG